MDTIDNKTRKKWNWELIFGIFFLIPSILGVFGFIYLLFRENYACSLGILDNLRGGFSMTPVYLGLMAMAGAYLIKNNLDRK